jgi:hypothetical protein
MTAGYNNAEEYFDATDSAQKVHNMPMFKEVAFRQTRHRK